MTTTMKTSEVTCPKCGADPSAKCFKDGQRLGAQTRRSKYHAERRDAAQSPPKYDEAIAASVKATEELARRVRRSTPSVGPSSHGHRHREPTQVQLAALDAALDTADAALQLCASLHPQGCPPQLQCVSSLLDEAVASLGDARRYVQYRFRGEAPRTRGQR